MGNRYRALSGDVAALSRAMDEAQDKETFRRIQAVFLRLSEGLTVEMIAAVTRFSKSWVRQLHHLFRTEGLEALCRKTRGGRHNFLFSEDIERAILQELEPDAKKGGILEVSKVHAIFEEKSGKKIAKQTIYNILHRHGWRKIAPRPKHPKADKEIQETFKKTGQKLSPLQKKKQPN